VDELLVAAKNNEALAGALDEVRDLLDSASDFSAGPFAGVPLSPSAARSRRSVDAIAHVDERFARGRAKCLSRKDAKIRALPGHREGYQGLSGAAQQEIP
jgi:hypothetical protein